jgi:hypothetical protein
MKHTWGKEQCTEWCTRNGEEEEEKSIAWIKAGMWKLRWIRRTALHV